MIDYDKKYALEQIRRSNHPLRRLLKYFFLNNILKDIDGPSIDIGCGACQLLNRLPERSIGFEVNAYLVDEMKKKGMNISKAKPGIDETFIESIKSGKFSFLVMSHVLEHFDDADQALKTVLKISYKKNIQKIIIVVPGLKGYGSDETHKTFINRAYLEKNNLIICEGYKVDYMRYFPINCENAGKYFIYNELKIVYKIIDQ
jgi:SAM-dependent methyltransferase